MAVPTDSHPHEKLVRSRQRVSDHGEVFTPAWLVDDMLDLVRDETERIDSRFLEPACGSGNFLVRVLERKLAVVRARHGSSEPEARHDALLALLGLYGIELLPDNAAECRERLLGVFGAFVGADAAWVGAARRVLDLSIVQGDALAMTDASGEHITFPEWAYGTDGPYPRRHVRLDDLTGRSPADPGAEVGAGLQFDVIVGNPPYQLSTGGSGVQAKPIYNLFVEQAKKLEPRFLVMVTPSRWFSGGMGLDRFRRSMLADRRLRVLEDFPDSNDVFPGTQIKGGISYWLWNRESPGDVRVATHDRGTVISVATRPLVETGADVFIRYNEGVSILRKVAAVESADPGGSVALPAEKQFMGLVSSIGAFGLDTTFRGSSSRGADDLTVYRNGGVGYLPRAELRRELHAVDAWKVFIPRAGSGSDSFPHSILGRPFAGEPGSISSWTYMYIGPFRSEDEVDNVISYIRTRLFRFLVLLHKPSQDATPRVYTFVPTQDFSRPWTDADLYARYGITPDEVAVIESLVRPMGVVGIDFTG